MDSSKLLTNPRYECHWTPELEQGVHIHKHMGILTGHWPYGPGPKRLLPPLAQILPYHGYITENKSLAYIRKISNSECGHILRFYSTFIFQHFHVCCLRLFSRSNGRELGQGSLSFSNKQRQRWFPCPRTLIWGWPSSPLPGHCFIPHLTRLLPDSMIWKVKWTLSKIGINFWLHKYHRHTKVRDKNTWGIQWMDLESNDFISERLLHCNSLFRLVNNFTSKLYKATQG